MTYPTETYFDLENLKKQEDMFCPVCFYCSLAPLKTLYHHHTGADDRRVVQVINYGDHIRK